MTNNGFTGYEVTSSGFTTSGTYLYRTPTLTSGADVYEVSISSQDDNYVSLDNPYFSKGINDVDCIELLFDFNLV